MAMKYKVKEILGLFNIISVIPDKSTGKMEITLISEKYGTFKVNSFEDEVEINALDKK
jgi:hypothetical protein